MSAAGSWHFPKVNGRFSERCRRRRVLVVLTALCLTLLVSKTAAAVSFVEDRDPLIRSVITEADLVTLPLHASNDVTDAAPRVEECVQKTKLGLAGVEEGKAESRDQRAAPLCGHLDALP